MPEYMSLAVDLLNTTLFTLNGNPITATKLLFIPVILLIGWLLLKWLTHRIVHYMETRRVNQDAIHLVRRVLFVLTIIILVITTLDILNIPLTAFAFISGAVAIGVGFGAQNIINNFISGWILMWERPIKIGDFLEIGDTAKGTVESINTRSTRIRRVDGVHILVPNSYLLENAVVNWTLIDQLARTSVVVGVAYGSPVKKVAELIAQAIEENDQVLNEPKPLVIFDDFGDNALIFDSSFWINANGERDLRVTRSDIRFRIEELFRENDIVVAFPQRDLHIDGSISVKSSTELQEGVEPTGS